MAASVSTNSQLYEVFINHRGVDTKETFARSLYLRLLQHGLRPFLDKHEMQPGYQISSQIKNAIRTASVHVAILSARYAESTWCLDELLWMLESHRAKMVPIIPVFYGVTPAQVRWTRGKDGIYAQALERLAKKRDHDSKPRHEPQTIENWRNALSQVADISGFELKECDIGEDMELEVLDKVVQHLSKLLKKPDLHVAKFPTGLDEKLKDFEDTVLLPQQRSGTALILGIWGLGGVGKTTLAKEFFNRKKPAYRINCFLSDFRENAIKDSLVSLQRKFSKSLTGLDKRIDSVDEGTGMLKKDIENLKFSNASFQRSTGLDKPMDSHVDNVSKILVILDDVHHQSQVDALLPVDLPSGSLIVITSRDKHVLLGSKVKESSIYRLTGLENQYSRELFCSHAFNETYPLPGFEDLVDKFLEACNGLPLSLKVFGANLYRRSVSYWKEELETFPSEIKGRLRISYDALAKQEQQMFLDIACFFTGEKRNTVISTWNGSGWKGGRRGFQILQDKCLVEVDSDNDIHMHDHLKELGRDIADESSPRRLWRGTKKVIADLLHQSSEIAVRGIQMAHAEDTDTDIDTENALPESILRGLQILDTEGERMLRMVEPPDISCLRWLRWIECPCKLLEHILRRVKLPNMERILRTVELPNILWLSWRNCPYSSLPSGISMKNLRFLRVSGSVLNTLWQTEGESQGSLQLPVCLEELRAGRCVKLKSIAGLAQLTKLRLLSISGCSELEELPSMDALVCLEELWAGGCVKLKRIRGLEQSTKLQKLSVKGCSELEELPSMDALVCLEELWARGCVKLKRIRGLEQATKLQKLSVAGWSELEELPSMNALVCLEELWADGCVKLKRIRGLEQATKLQILSVTGCSNLEELPSMEKLVSLEFFEADRCVKLKRIRGLEQAKKLQKLTVTGCSELEELPSIEALECLEELRADDCVKLKRVRGLEHATKLQTLSVTRCSELEELPSMEALVCLEELWAYDCVKLKRIRGLEQATKLQMLSVNGCSELEELPSMKALVCLEKLWANDCVKLKRIRGLQATKLQKLIVTGCSELEELPSMDALVCLEELWADGCVKLKRIRGLEQAKKLQMLSVTGCSELEELPSMEALVCLEELWANGCVKLKRIRGLEQATKLQILSFTGCSNLEELPSMEKLVSLELFEADKCVKLKRIRGLEQATKLQTLTVKECSELEELPSIEALECLEVLWADDCVKLKRIRGLEQATKLQALSVTRCSELEELPSMDALVCLEALWARGCVKLKRIRGLEQATKLQQLSVRGCSELEEVEGLEHMSLERLNISVCPRLQCQVWG